MESEQQADNSRDDEESSNQIKLHDPLEDGEVVRVVITGNVEDEEDNGNNQSTDWKAESFFNIICTNVLGVNKSLKVRPTLCRNTSAMLRGQ